MTTIIKELESIEEFTDLFTEFLKETNNLVDENKITQQISNLKENLSFLLFLYV